MEVVIERLDHFGRGICKIDGKICFVSNALVGERVLIEIVKETKKFYEAKAVQIIEKSPYRVEPPCPYYGKCGGCSLQHMSFDAENKFKEEKVKDMVERFASLSKDVVYPISYHDEYYYRNKITLHGDGHQMGLYAELSHDIIPIEKCMLVLPKINEALKEVPNSLECIIKCSNDGKDVLISSNHEGEILTSIGDYSFYQSSSSFFQVNATLTKDLYDEVLKAVREAKPSCVLDLYCGTGTIGIYVSKYCDSIVGVDYNFSNIEDAKRNAILNHVSNIQFLCDKVENQIDRFSNVDFIIVDPPRAGLDSHTKEILKTLKPKNLVYVSCDVSTLARDLKDLSDTFEVCSIKPFNLFPRTAHCESITVLERR